MTPIAMKCTQEQYNKIKPILLENGFEEENISCFEDYPYLINNWGPKNYKLGNGDLDYAIGRKVFHKWNEDIFLAYCDIVLKKEPLFTIQDLADGKCAVKHDGTQKELQIVLKAAYLLTRPWYGSHDDIEYYWTKDKYYWNNSDVNTSNLPTQSVKDFLKMINEKEPEFVLGKIWHIKVTEENQNIVSEWRFTDTSKKLNIGYVTGMYNWNGEGRRIFKEHNSYKDDNNWGDEITFEQFKKYVLKQEETYKYTPEYCKNNKVAIFVKTQSDIDGLNKLDCKGYIVSLNTYPNGFYTVPKCGTWGNANDDYYKNNNYEIINASDFIKNNLKTTNMEKKIIGYKLIKPEYENAALNLCRVSNFSSHKDYDFVFGSINYNKLKEAGVLDLWFEPVYEPLETKYTMGSNGNTFELIVKDGKCFHKQEDITNYLRDVQEFARRLPTKFGNYDFKLDIDSIKINKTGCESKETLLSQWLNIKL